MTLDDLFTMHGSGESQIKSQNLKGIKISMASPETIREWSFGEVKEPETINHRTFKPESDGLFCAKIFGPVKDYECNCGKYKRLKHRGIVCEKCGVEVIASKVRRDRMAHIELAAPMAHIWFLKSMPSKIASLLDMTMADVDKVLYFYSYIVIDPKQTSLKRYQLLNEDQHVQLLDAYGDQAFRVGMGAEAIKELLEDLNLEELRTTLKEDFTATRSQAKKKKLSKRLKIVEAFLESGNRPEWMILEVVPVIPPELRPLVPLDGGRFATFDLNELYRRVINCNNRVKRFLELWTPNIIIRNEKRELQEAVDALLDNGRRGKAITGTNGQPLKSLSDMIKGKQGRFRQNLLGKRVDYSGRSVIVVGPKLKLHQCGLPKKMALELFKPFIYAKLEEQGYTSTIKGAKRMVEREDVVVWDMLEEVVQEYPILLNRAPTLHRLGIQAFEPTLVEGKAIQLHPLVCAPYNADFDGDQMAVHIPLSVEARIECRVLMMSTNNILSPANGDPIVLPSQDIVLGLYYLSLTRAFEPGEGKFFSSPGEVICAYDAGAISLHARIKVRIDGEMLDTSAGRIIIGQILPENVPFYLVNTVLNKKTIARLVAQAYQMAGTKATVILSDRLKDLGFEYSTQAGFTISVQDLQVPEEKKRLLADAHSEAEAIHSQHQEGIITRTERYNKVLDVWTKTTNDVAKAMMREISQDKVVNPRTQETILEESFNPIYLMRTSGSRGNADQMRQLAGMRGLMAKPSGEIIETPITSSFREGLSVLEYFTSTHGARKGLADKALKTANFGYLTRRLVDVVQDVIVSELDCGTVDGIEITRPSVTDEQQETLIERILGRMAMFDIFNPETKDLLVPANTLIDERAARRIEDAGVHSVVIRSVLTCQSRQGVCAYCYGRDLARGNLINVGESVGIIAAQSIGEPGTQLTMRAFHIGGTASKEIEQSSIIAGYPGQITLIGVHTVRNKEGQLMVMGRNGQIGIVENQSRERERYTLPAGARLFVQAGDTVHAGDVLARKSLESTKIKDIISDLSRVEELFEVRKPKDLAAISEIEGTVSFGPDVRDKRKIIITPEAGDQKEFLVPKGKHITVQEGEFVEAGELLTEGVPEMQDLLKVKGEKYLAKYLVDEVQHIYRFHGININNKHFEIIVRRMLNKVSVTDPGGTNFIFGEQVGKLAFLEGNSKAILQGDKPATAQPLVLGITQASLNTDSFISAASFQGTTKVLTDAVMQSKTDFLQGLKENVIIGRVIPVGTGFRPYMNLDIQVPEHAEQPDRTE